MIQKATLALGAFLALADVAPLTAQDTAEPAVPPKWLVSCSNHVNFDELLCEFSQSIVLTNTAGQSQRVATASFARAVGKTETDALFTLPYEVSLPVDPTISVDDTALGTLSWQSCDAGGCYASGPVQDAWLQAMRAGTQLTAKLVARDGGDVTLTFSLEGFSRAEGMLP